MKFPKQELDVDAYFNKIEALLNDSQCHIFIDTNIISQLYRLNEDARNDFYSWVDSCKERFHIPNWSVHEYSNRVTTQKTKDYLSELTKAKTYAKELNNISRFMRGYVGDSLLVGSVYEKDKERLFTDVDDIVNRFEIIANAINKNLVNHQQAVHKEVLDKLNCYTIDSDIFSIMQNLKSEQEFRFNCMLPPGYKDSDKPSNNAGDLIIWKEIIDFCKSEESNIKKAILVSRDNKPDMVYRPSKQSRGEKPNVKDIDKVSIAHESLVYEFKLATGSDDFYLINFYTLVQVLSSKYRDLATSFQIATEHENILDKATSLSCVDENIMGVDRSAESSTEQKKDAQIDQVDIADEKMKYSTSALADEFYDTTEGVQSINKCIEDLKSYNWYVQNPAINELMNLSLSFSKVADTRQNRDSFFVLGRNILQSADGASGSAIYFINHLALNLSNWRDIFKEAFIDGCLYEVFFDSMGQIRQKAFKASYFEEVVKHANKLDKPYLFDFINEQLQQKEEERFVPKVNSNKVYKFEFEFYEKDESDIFNEMKTKLLKINDRDVSETFISDYMASFSDVESIKQNLSTYYAIPVNDIELKPLPEEVKYIYYIDEDKYRDYISF
ncbi:MAG: PIN-like domain-containing protein [Bacteroidales bacterium]|nr:PIN-like domain-containing protein [Bacteroidales bacterium]